MSWNDFFTRPFNAKEKITSKEIAAYPIYPRGFYNDLKLNIVFCDITTMRNLLFFVSTHNPKHTGAVFDAKYTATVLI